MIGLALGLLGSQSNHGIADKVATAKAQIDDTLLAYLHDCQTQIDLRGYMVKNKRRHKSWTGTSSAPSSTVEKIVGADKENVAFSISQQPPSRTYVLFPNDDWRAERLILELEEQLATTAALDIGKQLEKLLATVRRHKKLHDTRSLFQALCEMLEWTLGSKKVQDSPGTVFISGELWRHIH